MDHNAQIHKPKTPDNQPENLALTTAMWVSHINLLYLLLAVLILIWNAILQMCHSEDNKIMDFYIKFTVLLTKHHNMDSLKPDQLSSLLLHIQQYALP